MVSISGKKWYCFNLEMTMITIRNALKTVLPISFYSLTLFWFSYINNYNLSKVYFIWDDLWYLWSWFGVFVFVFYFLIYYQPHFCKILVFWYEIFNFSYITFWLILWTNLEKFANICKYDIETASKIENSRFGYFTII